MTKVTLEVARIPSNGIQIIEDQVKRPFAVDS